MTMLRALSAILSILVLFAILLVSPLAYGEISNDGPKGMTGMALQWRTFYSAELDRRSAQPLWDAGVCTDGGAGWTYLTGCRPEIYSATPELYASGWVWMAPDRSQTFKIDPAAYVPDWHTRNPVASAEWIALPYAVVNSRDLDLVFFNELGYVCRHCPWWVEGRGVRAGLPGVVLPGAPPVVLP